jgi:putative transcriptional regulator
MDPIRHHPKDEILLRYASGAYDTAFNLTLATHVGMCPTCQKTVHLHQSLGGNVLDAQEPAPMSIDASSVLDKLEDEEVADQPAYDVVSVSSDGSDIPPILKTYLGGDFDTIKWQRLSPGLKQHLIHVDGKASARLIWIKQGHAVPAHGHTGEEFTMVLTGGYFDGDEPFTKGDMQFADHKAPHMPTAMDDGPCIVLAAMESPMVFQNIIPRILQPFFKI